MVVGAAAAVPAVAALLWTPEAAVAPGPAATVAPPSRREPAQDFAGWESTILARPLFSATRRHELTSSPTLTLRVSPQLPRLAGTMVTDGQRVAVLVAAGSDHGSTVREGGEVDGLQVVRIEPGVVTLAGTAGRVSVRTGFEGVERSTAAMATLGPVGPDGRPVIGGDRQDE